MKKIKSIFSKNKQHPEISVFDKIDSKMEFKKYEIFKRRVIAIFCIFESVLLDAVYDYPYMMLDKK